MPVRHFALLVFSCSLLACSNEAEPGGSQLQTAGFTSSAMPSGLSSPRPASPSALTKTTGPKPVHSSLGAEVKVVGVMLNGPTRADFGGDPALAFMGSLTQTRVALEVYLPSGGIIDVDTERSTLRTFADDRGTDFLAEPAFGGPFEFMSNPAEDGRSVVVYAAGNPLPAKGSGLLRLEGKLSLTTASTPKTHVTAGVELLPGSAFSAGPFDFKVTETGPSDWSESWSFTVETEDDLAAVIAWKLIDAEGREHAPESFMTMSFNGTTQQALQTDEITGPVTLELEVWDDARQIEVPFAVTTGLGF